MLHTVQETDRYSSSSSVSIEIELHWIIMDSNSAVTYSNKSSGGKAKKKPCKFQYFCMQDKYDNGGDSIWYILSQQWVNRSASSWSSVVGSFRNCPSIYFRVKLLKQWFGSEWVTLPPKWLVISLDDGALLRPRHHAKLKANAYFGWWWFTRERTSSGNNN